MRAMTTYTHLIWECLFQVDRNRKHLDIEETINHCNDGTIIEWLHETTDMDMSLIRSPEGRPAYEQLVELFGGLTAVNHSQKFGVEHDGYHLLIAYCVQGIQQLESLSRDTSG
jgi:hypothetical protein